MTLALNPHTYMFYFSKLADGNAIGDTIPFLTAITDFATVFAKHKFVLCTAAVGHEIRETPYLAAAITYIPFDATAGMLIPRERLRRAPLALGVATAAIIKHKYVFNPGLIGRRPDGTYTAVLQPGDDLVIAPRTSAFKWGISETPLILLGRDYQFKGLVGSVETEDPWSREDVRLFVGGSGDLCLYSSYIWDYTTGDNNRILCSWRRFAGGENFVPPYGRSVTGPEKNWGFFFAGSDNPLTIYSHSPTWIIIDAVTGGELAKREMPETMPHLHGGAPPFYWRGDWWSFCHSKGTYDTYVVVFEDSTWMPKAWGRLMARGDLGHEVNFVFVTGAVACGDEKVILAAGLNDTETVFFEFGAAEIYACLQGI